MRIFSIATAGLLTLVLAFAAVTSASGQTSAHKKTFGYKDEVTGEFHSFTKAVPEATIAPLTGTIQVTFTITLKTAVPTGGSVYCSTDTSATSLSLTAQTATSYNETSYVVAKVTGSTATCTVNTPYSWQIAPASSTVQNSLDGTYTVGILPANTGGSLLQAVEDRVSTSSFVTGAKVPATGAVTHYAVNVTL